jgi:ArsR family transcriptional regulator
MVSIVTVAEALSHHTRVQILELLGRRRETGAAAGDIARELEVGPTTLSRHLAELVQAGLIRAERSGKSLIYRSRPDELRVFISEIAHLT